MMSITINNLSDFDRYLVRIDRRESIIASACVTGSLIAGVAAFATGLHLFFLPLATIGAYEAARRIWAVTLYGMPSERLLDAIDAAMEDIALDGEAP